MNFSNLKSQSFLVRLWRTSDDEWRARVEPVGTQQCYMFSDLEALLAFFQGEVDKEEHIQHQG